jgi:hypothetical protein
MAALGVIIVNEALRFLLNVNLTQVLTGAQGLCLPKDQNKMAPAGAIMCQ